MTARDTTGCEPGCWIDRTRPNWPREVNQAHLDADADHAAVGDGDPADGGDGLHDNCKVCGLATTSDGKLHGFDA